MAFILESSLVVGCRDGHKLLCRFSLWQGAVSRELIIKCTKAIPAS